MLFFNYSPLTDEQKSIENAMIRLVVKDQDLFGIANKFVSECFVTFDQIAHSNGVQQIHLKLTRPTTTGASTIGQSHLLC